MAQLPPKIPSNYLLPCHQTMASFFPSSPNSAAAHWALADEFFDFHRPTVAHSRAIFEPLAAASSTVPPTPSDHNSSPCEDNIKPNSEAESCSNLDLSATSTDYIAQPILDPKRARRILANRQSARRSRVRKLQYISELERSMTSLQTEVSALSPRVAFLDHQRSILVIDNSHLKQRIAALAQDMIFKDAHQESLKNEIERLSLVYQQQNLKKMAAMTTAIHDAGRDDTATINVVQNDQLQVTP